MGVHSLSVAGEPLPFSPRALAGSNGFIVDTGVFGLQLPPAVLAMTLRQIERAYLGPLAGDRMQALLESANITGLSWF